MLSNRGLRGIINETNQQEVWRKGFLKKIMESLDLESKENPGQENRVAEEKPQF